MLYIIDGHNVLKHHPILSSLVEQNFADAKSKLLQLMIDFRKKKRNASYLLIFDNDTVKHSSSEMSHGINIMYAPIGKKADDVIARKALDLRNRKIEFCLVTSDIQLRNRCSGRFMRWMSSTEFIEACKPDSGDFSGEKPKMNGLLPDKDVDGWLKIFEDDNKGESL